MHIGAGLLRVNRETVAVGVGRTRSGQVEALLGHVKRLGTAGKTAGCVPVHRCGQVNGHHADDVCRLGRIAGLGEARRGVHQGRCSPAIHRHRRQHGSHLQGIEQALIRLGFLFGPPGVDAWYLGGTAQHQIQGVAQAARADQGGIHSELAGGAHAGRVAGVDQRQFGDALRPGLWSKPGVINTPTRRSLANHGHLLARRVAVKAGGLYVLREADGKPIDLGQRTLGTAGLQLVAHQHVRARSHRPAFDRLRGTQAEHVLPVGFDPVGFIYPSLLQGRTGHGHRSTR